MTDFARAILERDLRARSQVARLNTLNEQAPEPYQTTLPMLHAPRLDANEEPVQCGHAGTGRAPQRRLFGAGWDTVCTRCGQVV